MVPITALGQPINKCLICSLLGDESWKDEWKGGISPLCVQRNWAGCDLANFFDCAMIIFDSDFGDSDFEVKRRRSQTLARGRSPFFYPDNIV
ncbi:hypothetical protein [Nostoc sp. C117]|uniref:hypothetical protein n=1 Tax=Nostoc sp. C117 TaxID=3349875 RepID=UPI00370DC557